MKFPESKHAHKWLDGKSPGIEIGGSAHNSFNISGCVNVDYTDDPDTVFKRAEIDLCGEAAKVDVVDDGGGLSKFKESSLKYILSSHVFEHFPNPARVLIRWWNVLTDGGLIYVIVPHRDALDADACRPVTTVAHLWDDYQEDATEDTHPVEPGHGKRGHYHVFTYESFNELVRSVSGYMRATLWTDPDGDPPLEVVDSLPVDDKVGNGFVYVIRVNK